MLPFDNKNELARGHRHAARHDAGGHRRRRAATSGAISPTVAEVTDYETFVGVASPMDFNGMVRHYYLRRGGNVGDIRINLLPKEARTQQSHEIALRIRPEIERIARAPRRQRQDRRGAAGTAGSRHARRRGLRPARRPPTPTSSPRRSACAARWSRRPGVVDVDDFAEADHERVHYRLDRDKAALTGVTVAEAAQTLQTAVGGGPAGRVHVAERATAARARACSCRATVRSSMPDSAGAAGEVGVRRAGAARRDRRTARRAGRTHDLSQEPTAGGVRHRRDGRPQPGRGGVRSQPVAAATTRCRPATASTSPVKASGRSPSMCSATSAWRSPRRC